MESFELGLRLLALVREADAEPADVGGVAVRPLRQCVQRVKNLLLQLVAVRVLLGAGREAVVRAEVARAAIARAAAERRKRGVAVGGAVELEVAEQPPPWQTQRAFRWRPRRPAAPLAAGARQATRASA